MKVVGASLAVALGALAIPSTSAYAVEAEQKLAVAKVEADSVGADVRQEARDVPEFDKIRTPSSPAFTLLGVSPTQIERPNTPKQLVVALGTFVSKDNLTIPQNLALEFSPYWLWSHPKLTLKDYGRTDGQNIYRNLTISIATSTAEAKTDAAGTPAEGSSTDLAVGVRTQVIQGDQRRPCADRVDGLSAKLLAVANLVSLNLSEEETKRLEEPFVDWNAVADKVLTAEEKAQLDGIRKFADRRRWRQELLDAHEEADPGNFNRARKAAVNLTGFQSVLQARKEQLVAEAKQKIAQLDGLFEICAEQEAARRGFLMDIAGAAAGRFGDGHVDTRDWLSWAVWTNLAYEGEGTSVVAMGRYRRDKVAGTWLGHLDLGLRGIVARQKYALSLEGVGRARVGDIGADEDRWSYRLALAGEYMVSDGSWLSVTFGKDSGASQPGSLFTLANLKWGFGSPIVKPGP